MHAGSATRNLTQKEVHCGQLSFRRYLTRQYVDLTETMSARILFNKGFACWAIQLESKLVRGLHRRILALWRPPWTLSGKRLATSSQFNTLRSQLLSSRMDETARGQLLDGKIVAGEIQSQIMKKTQELRDATGTVPCLAIVQVGDRSDSNVYIRMKVKTAAEVGIHASHVKLPSDITQDQLMDLIEQLNRDSSVHGIIVQLPLECIHPVDASKVTDTILPQKDVDGLHTTNAGHVARGEFDKCTLPCTPNGCLELIKKSGRIIGGSRAVVLGRSKIVGGPMAEMLMWNNATVTICHSKTENLPAVVKEADILVVAIGRANFVKADWIKPGAVVIDCGINIVPDSTLKSGRRIVGDVDFAEAKGVASYITPVPGGVGPMTVAMLLRNTLDCALKMAKFV